MNCSDDKKHILTLFIHWGAGEGKGRTLHPQEFHHYLLHEAQVCGGSNHTQHLHFAIVNL